MGYRTISFVLLCAFFTGCCKEEFLFTGDIDVSLVERPGGETILGTVADTIRGPFLYQARLSYDLLSALPAIRPAQLLFAFSCDETYDQTLNEASVRIYLDRSFFFEGQPYPAEADLIALLIGEDTSSTAGYVSSQGAMLQFDASLLQRMELPPADYTITFEGELEDGTPISQSTRFYLAL